jgi:hypothetical protein
MRHAADARPAPVSPKIQQHVFAAKIGQRHARPVLPALDLAQLWGRFADQGSQSGGRQVDDTAVQLVASWNVDFAVYRQRVGAVGAETVLARRQIKLEFVAVWS